MAQKKQSFATRNSGHLILAVAVLSLLVQGLGPNIALIAFALSGLWVLFFAGTWCGAANRTGEHCRNNSYGLLGGCHIRQHRWQRLKALVGMRRLGEVCRGWFTGAPQRIATCSLIASGLGSLFALGQLVLAAAAG